ncbi:hypothetical protein HPP92_018402 [Vanilla planifolia]|uniref:Uncharacterized protein n=1 Tax=Vanilla planifolia TaxID=51239 RepID=A0A835UMV0_VANPL|nr:hypothetical protein HPP92_018402 [Vanilla planifolia]
MASSAQMDLFSSVISDIKTYAGKALKDSLGFASSVVSEKLLDFPSRNALRLSNQTRTIPKRFQIHSYGSVKEPRAILRKMKRVKSDMLPIACEATSGGNTSQTTAVEIDVCRLHRNALQEKSPTKRKCWLCTKNKRLDQPQAFTTKGMDESNQSCRDDMMMLKIADSGILGKSPAPNACHHGLLVPTVNMKESTDSICNMLKDALEQESISRSSNVGKSKSNHHGHAIQVFVDEDIEEPRGDANSQ